MKFHLYSNHDLQLSQNLFPEASLPLKGLTPSLNIWHKDKWTNKRMNQGRGGGENSFLAPAPLFFPVFSYAKSVLGGPDQVGVSLKH